MFFASVCAHTISEGELASSKIQAQHSQSLIGLPANDLEHIILLQAVKPCSMLNIFKNLITCEDHSALQGWRICINDSTTT